MFIHDGRSEDEKRFSARVGELNVKVLESGIDLLGLAKLLSVIVVINEKCAQLLKEIDADIELPKARLDAFESANNAVAGRLPPAVTEMWAEVEKACERARMKGAVIAIEKDKKVRQPGRSRGGKTKAERSAELYAPAIAQYEASAGLKKLNATEAAVKLTVKYEHAVPVDQLARKIRKLRKRSA